MTHIHEHDTRFHTRLYQNHNLQVCKRKLIYQTLENVHVMHAIIKRNKAQANRTN